MAHRKLKPGGKMMPGALRRVRAGRKRDAKRKRKQLYSTRRRRTCKTVCTVCGGTYPKGPMTAAKYVKHVSAYHTAKVYC